MSASAKLKGYGQLGKDKPEDLGPLPLSIAPINRFIEEEGRGGNREHHTYSEICLVLHL